MHIPYQRVINRNLPFFGREEHSSGMEQEMTFLSDRTFIYDKESGMRASLKYILPNTPRTIRSDNKQVVRQGCLYFFHFAAEHHLLDNALSV